MIALSGSARPGVMSRRRASMSRCSQSARTTARLRGLRTLWMPDVRRHGSARGGCGAAARTAANSCSAQASLPCASRSRCTASRSRPAVRRRGRRTAATAPEEAALTSRRLSDLSPASSPAVPRPSDRARRVRSLRRPPSSVSKMRGGSQSHLAQAGQVLSCCVQNPFGVREHRAQCGEVRAGDRVDQHVPAPSRRSCTR